MNEGRSYFGHRCHHEDALVRVDMGHDELRRFDASIAKEEDVEIDLPRAPPLAFATAIATEGEFDYNGPDSASSNPHPRTARRSNRECRGSSARVAERSRAGRLVLCS